MKGVTGVVLLVVVALGVVEGLWDSCGNGDLPLKISDATITPDPPIKGKKFNVTYYGTIGTQQTGGSQEFSVYEKILDHWIKGPFSTTFDICKNNACPWGPKVKLNMTEELPSFVPDGEYKVRTTVFDTNKKEIGCVEVLFTLE